MTQEGKTTTVLVTLRYETNNQIVKMLAERNKEISKHEKGFVTKSELISEMIEDYFINDDSYKK